MKSKKRLTVLLLSLMLSLCLVFALPTAASASEVATDSHIEQYRPQLSYTQNRNWNNDPNGLLYVPNGSGGGTYHLYYQYAVTGNKWDAMHWGHATSEDLVHWQEHSVAIEPLWISDDAYKADNKVPTGPIFSGSAVYVSPENASRGYNGEGFYAIFTQPKTAEERDAEAEDEGTFDQRQTVAYSDNGEKFEHSQFLEILPTANNLKTSDGESIGLAYPGDFRDPKVFWNDGIGKWMMVVGGGEIVQFVSNNLRDWEFVGSTGFWGECPDLFPLKTKDGETVWVLLMSPEDKPESHLFNGTSRETHEYPNEYYILGECDENGLFSAYEGETLRKFSFGVDSYAGQTFNAVPDGRRIGVSWSASWKTVDDYAEKKEGGLRDNWNGGVTMIYELSIEEIDGALTLCRNPIEEYEALREGAPLYKNDTATITETNLLEDKSASLAEVDITLDVSDATASKVTLALASSAYEHTDIIYDLQNQTLTVDRSNSSLSAANTARYRIPYTVPLTPQNNKVRIHAYLDWGNLFISGGKGEVSANVAIFPSLFSNGMSLTSDGEVSASVAVYELNGIWNNATAKDEFDSFYLSAKDEIMYVGDTLTVLACSPNPDFVLADMQYTADNDTVTVSKRTDGSLSVVANKTGSAEITAKYGSKEKKFTINVLSGAVQSDLDFVNPYAGKWIRNGGIIGSASGDGFIYTQESYTNFSLSATVTAASDDAVAFGIMFAAGDNYHTFYCANYDYAGKEVKLWMSGGESIATYPLALRRGEGVHYKVTVYNGDITIEVNGQVVIVASHGLYESGHLGLNIYNGSFVFDDIELSSVYGVGEEVCENVGEKAFIVRNETLKTYLTSSDYAVESGVLTLKQEYVSALIGGKKYDFSVLFEDGSKKSFMLYTYAAVQIFDSYRVLGSGDSLTLALSLGLASVQNVLLDGKEIEYSCVNSMLTLSQDVISALAEGDHTLRIITDKGSIDFVFGYKIVPPAPVNKTGIVVSIISVALVGCLIIGFVVYWIASKKRKSAEKE